ncbi:hypothetical protein GCM10027511_09690 [Hymenobacter humi]
MLSLRRTFSRLNNSCKREKVLRAAQDDNEAVEVLGYAELRVDQLSMTFHLTAYLDSLLLGSLRLGLFGLGGLAGRVSGGACGSILEANDAFFGGRGFGGAGGRSTGSGLGGLHRGAHGYFYRDRKRELGWAVRR